MRLRSNLQTGNAGSNQQIRRVWKKGGNNPSRHSSVSTIHDLPVEIQVHLFKYFEGTTLKQLRLVCLSWKTIVDTLIGLPVVINDAARGNTLFIEKIGKTRIRIKHLRKGTVGVLRESISPHLTKCVAISGIIRHAILEDLMPFFCLKKLVLEDFALSQDIFDSNICNLHFQNLEILELRTLSDYHLIMSTHWLLAKLSLVVARNLYFMLSNTTAPRLKFLYVDGDVDQYDLPVLVNWKLEPLRKFLSVHKTTLEKLILSENNTVEVDSLFDFENKTNYDSAFPIHLKTLNITLQGVNRSTYWCNLIKSQSSLEDIDIGMIDYPFSLEIFQSLPHTLKTISVFYNYDPEEILDLRVFTRMPFLQKLQLMYDGARGIELVNFCSLSNCKNLTVLEISQCLIKTADLESLHIIAPQLESLYLLRTAFRKPRLQGYKLSLLALKNILSLRYLKFFHCEFRDMGDNIENVRTMKLIINELIKNPRLVFFVGENSCYPTHAIFRKINFFH